MTLATTIALLIAQHDETVATLTAERDALLEDRARFPDRPDGIGLMIAAHIGNLKAAAEQGKRDSLAAVQERDALAATMDRVKSLALDVADDLEAELKARYARPQQQRYYDRDMTTVVALRAALQQPEHNND